MVALWSYLCCAFVVSLLAMRKESCKRRYNLNLHPNLHKVCFQAVLSLLSFSDLFSFLRSCPLPLVFFCTRKAPSCNASGFEPYLGDDVFVVVAVVADEIQVQNVLLDSEIEKKTEDQVSGRMAVYQRRSLEYHVPFFFVSLS